LNKSELRQIYLEKRQSLSPDELKVGSEAVANRFFEAFDLNGVQILDIFVSIARFNEIDTSTIFHGIWSGYPQIITTAPRVNHENGHLEHFAFGAESDLLQNNWGISEPVPGVVVTEEMIDMVLVPLLCFDRDGHRVGYGKGFYDKFLARCRPDCISVGLSYYPPVDRIDDVGEHDIRLDHVITLNEAFSFN
jgi:5-formyltetrahydrofolate cyclo-ligase